MAPLDWGLGHATRCVPLIHALLNHQFRVVLAADGRAFNFLAKEFPDLSIIRLEGYKVHYPAKRSFFLNMFLSTLPFYQSIRKEHKAIQVIASEHHIDAIISDNRYGLWSKNITSVFLGHQMFIKVPGIFKWAEGLMHRLNQYFIRHFDEHWIPDYQGKYNLSGDLSHKKTLPEKAHFIGPLSRFFLPDDTTNEAHTKKYDGHLLVILSGPEPQRTILETKLLHQLKKSSQKTIVVRGLTEKTGNYMLTPDVKVLQHAATTELNRLILGSELVICRPGYSSIMDLSATGKRAVFIPTPGQTEQEYLAKYFFNNKVFYYEDQKSFNLERALEKSTEFEGFQLRYNPSLLEERINKLQELINNQASF